MRRVLFHESDEALMEKVKLGERGAFETLYERYKNPMLSFTQNMTGRRAVAEELTQEIFLRVYKHASTYEPTAKFTTWLWTIARNLCLDSLKKKKEVLLKPDPETGSDLISEVESPINNAEADLVLRTEKVELEKCIQELTEAQREALSLRTFADVSYEEIAKAMKVSVASVKSLLFRAKESLISCMKKGAHHE